MKSSPARRLFNSLSPTCLEDAPQKQRSRSELPLNFLITDYRSLSSVSISGNSSPNSRRSSFASTRFSQENNKDASSTTEATNLITSPRVTLPKEIISGTYYGAQDKAFIKNKVKKIEKKATDSWVPHNDIFSLSAAY